tara:strand:- start:423 stop:773 length:351 start_codon:yes stop_codon:yes gene_type:complete
MSTTSNKAHADFPTLISDTTLTSALETKQLTGDTGRVYSIHVENGHSGDIFFAIYDSDNPTAGSAQTCLFRCDQSVNVTITSKTGIPISTGLSYNAGDSAAGGGTVNSSKAYIFGS